MRRGRGRIRRFLVGLLATVGFLVLLLVAVAATGIWWLRHRLPGVEPLPERIVLEVDLRGTLPEREEGVGLASLPLGREPTVSDVVLALDRAREDGRVQGLVAWLDEGSHGLAVTQELREAVQRFRASGRFTFAYADTFGELTSGNQGYYLATGFERIWLQPIGLVGLTGLSLEVPFLEGLLGKLGVEFVTGKRAEYKSALDSLTEPGLTPANREQLDAVLDDAMSQLVGGLEEGRGIPRERARQLLTGGPYTSEEALAAGLVDRVAHKDELVASAREQAGGAEVVKLVDYRDSVDLEPSQPVARVALVHAVGPIQRGEDGFGARIAGDDLAETLAEAIDDDRIRAILLRVDSPGGSAVASETIARQVRRAVAAGKPVVVSMGNYAASGGYWIAMGASRIVAQPATLTGSIGVIAGKPVLTGLWDRLDVRWDAVRRGENADMWSLNEPFDSVARARLETVLDQLYGSFKAGVAEGRKLGPAEVEAIAKGRVWTGAAAVGLGLVDRLGGLAEAMAELREVAGLPEGAPLAIEPYPEPESPLGRLLELVTGRSESVPEPSLRAILTQLLALGSARMPAIVIR